MQKVLTMIIGNIVSNLEIEKEPNFNYYRFDSLVGMDDSVPTIFLGYKETKNIYGKVNPLDKVIEHNKYWTFARNENQKEMNKDLFNFKILCHKNYVDNYKYIYVSPMHSLSLIKKVIAKITSEIENSLVIIGKKGMIYIYFDTFIIGLDVETLKFINIKTDKLIRRLRTNAKSFYTYANISNEAKYFGDILGSDMYCGLAM